MHRKVVSGSGVAGAAAAVTAVVLLLALAAVGPAAAGATSRAVAWRYQHDSSSAADHRRGCSGSVRYAHGDAGSIRTHNLACGRAKHVIDDALHHGLVGVSGGLLRLDRTHILGFHWTVHRFNLFRAQRGNTWLTFGLCWFGVTC